MRQITGGTVKPEDILKDIHEKVTDIRLHQVKHEERIKELQKDTESHSKAIEKLKASNNKVAGAGIFVGLLATLSKFWENIAG